MTRSDPYYQGKSCCSTSYILLVLLVNLFAYISSLLLTENLRIAVKTVRFLKKSCGLDTDKIFGELLYINYHF